MAPLWFLVTLLAAVSLAAPCMEILPDLFGSEVLPRGPDCCFNGTVVEHGEMAATLPNKCLQLICRRGKIKTRFVGSPGDTFCCEFAGKMYQSGALLQVQCVSLRCTAIGWIPGRAIKEYCGHCSLQDDPHIYTFDGHQYDWHGTCNYSVMQTDLSHHPHTGLFSDFQPCNTHASCLRHTTFRDNPHTVISLANDDIFNVLVNGDLFPVEAEGVATAVRSSAGVHPVLAWRNGVCVILLGASMVMVQHCPHRLDVWTHPRHIDTLDGLCGHYNHYTDDDFTARDGDVHDLEYCTPTFPVSWLTKDQIDFLGHYKMKRCMPKETNSCHADGKLQAQYRSLCRTYFGHIVDLDERLLPHLRTCAFDICMMRQAGRGDGAVRQWLLTLTDNVAISASLLNLTLPSPRPSLSLTNVTLETCGCVVQLRPILQEVSQQLPRLLVILVELQAAIREKGFESYPKRERRMIKDCDNEKTGGDRDGEGDYDCDDGESKSDDDGESKSDYDGEISNDDDGGDDDGERKSEDDGSDDDGESKSNYDDDGGDNEGERSDNDDVDNEGERSDNDYVGGDYEGEKKSGNDYGYDGEKKSDNDDDDGYDDEKKGDSDDDGYDDEKKGDNDDDDGYDDEKKGDNDDGEKKSDNDNDGYDDEKKGDNDDGEESDDDDDDDDYDYEKQSDNNNDYGYDGDDDNINDYDAIVIAANKTLMMETLTDEMVVIITVVIKALNALVSASSQQRRSVMTVIMAEEEDCPTGYVTAALQHFVRVAEESQVIRENLPLLPLGEEFMVAVQVMTERVAEKLMDITKLQEDIAAMSCY